MSTTRPPRTIRLDNLGPVCRGSCDIDGDDHYHAARIEDRAEVAAPGEWVTVEGDGSGEALPDAGLRMDLHGARPGPLSEGNQDAGGIPRGPWDDR